MATPTFDAPLDPKEYEQISGPTTATALAPATDATLAIIQATDQNIRWRDDGTNPTTSIGMQLAAGQDMLYAGDLSAIRLIEESASAKVNVSYYGANTRWAR